MWTQTEENRASVYKQLRDGLGDKYADMLETITEEVCIHSLAAGDSAIDCGANVGRFSLLQARCVGPTGKVHAFEPSPKVLEYLREKFKRHAQETHNVIRLHEVAVGAQEGRAPFLTATTAISGLGSLRAQESHQQHPELGFQQIYVPVKRLDDVVSTQERVRSIKIDIEGGELNALRGAKRILRQNRPVVVFENGRQFAANAFNYTMEDFFSFFENLDYRLFDAFCYSFTRKQWMMSGVPWQLIAVPKEFAFERLRKPIMARLEKFADA